MARWRKPNWAYWREQPSFWPSDLAYLGADIEPPARSGPFPLAIVEHAAGWLAAHGLYPYEEDPATGAMTLLPVSRDAVLRGLRKSAPPAGLFDGLLQRIEPALVRVSALELQQDALAAAHRKLALDLSSRETKQQYREEVRSHAAFKGRKEDTFRKAWQEFKRRHKPDKSGKQFPRFP